MEVMHIPDGFLATPVWVGLDIAALPAVGYAARRAKMEMAEARVPLLGIMGAFVFAAQMMNFPVGVGTSGHLLGGSLLSVLLGPWAATLVLTAILILQALVFQDGGALVVGANIINMAVIGVWGGYLPYRYLSSGGWRRFGVFAGAFLSVLLSAAVALGELRLSGVAMNSSVVGISSGLFVVTAAIEGIITLSVVQAVERLNPGWIRQPSAKPSLTIGVLAAASILLVAVGVLFASGAPDGLESLAQRAGFASQAQILWPALMADYELDAFRSEWLRRAGAGLLGLLLIYGMCLGVGRLIARQRGT